MRYDHEGNCIEVPSQKTCPRGIGVRNYPLVQRGPLIWGWMGKGAADPQKLPDTSWLEHGEWPCSQGYFHLPANYVSLHENLLDLTHLTFVHAKSFGTPDYASAPYECTTTESRFRITRRVVPTRLPPVWAKPTGIEHDQAARITTSEFVSPALHLVDAVFYDCNLPADARREFRIRTAHLPTPETNQSTHYFIVHGRDFGHDDPGITGFMHEQLFKAFQEDIEALTRLETVLDDPGDPYYEISVASDQPSVTMRRHLKKRALMDSDSAGAPDGAAEPASAVAEAT
jgi:vanillate O-demethylase monooxygenase subunit